MSKHDIESMDTAICPHCGADNGCDEIRTAQDMTCCECDKEFHVQPDYSVTYSTSCVDHTWPDEWRESAIDGWQLRKCIICDEIGVREKP